MFKNILTLAAAFIFTFNSQANTEQLSKEGLLFVENAQKALIDNLNDPDSAKLRKLMYFNDVNNKMQILCGEINAKNRMGGYVGYRKFFIASNGRSDIGGNDHSQYYDSYCSNREKNGLIIK